MGNRAKFWRLFVTSVLAYPLNYLIASFYFLLFLLFLTSGLLPGEEIFLAYLAWLVLFGSVLPLLSLTLTVAAPTKATRAICHFVSLNLIAFATFFQLANAFGGLSMAAVDGGAGSYDDRFHQYLTATLQSNLRAQLIILPWAWFSLRFIINRRHPLPPPIASSQDSIRPSPLS